MDESSPGPDAPEPKPDFLGRRNASAFQDPSVVRAYGHRPPYPAAVFERLIALLEGMPRRVLDIGCGTGVIARRLAPLVERVDAVDISALMVAEGQRLPDGDHPNLHWTVAALEDVPLAGPYGLVTAGASLHWMAWDVVLPRLADVLAPGGQLAIVSDLPPVVPWHAERRALIQRYSTIQDFQELDLPAEIERRGLFRLEGRIRTEPEAFTQSLDEYVESYHGRASFSRDRMRADDAAAFDSALRSLVRSHCPDERVTLQIIADVAWGRPLAPSAA